MATIGTALAVTAIVGVATAAIQAGTEAYVAHQETKASNRAEAEETKRNEQDNAAEVREAQIEERRAKYLADASGNLASFEAGNPDIVRAYEHTPTGRNDGIA